MITGGQNPKSLGRGCAKSMTCVCKYPKQALIKLRDANLSKVLDSSQIKLYDKYSLVHH